jgi:hypothetical protein
MKTRLAIVLSVLAVGVVAASQLAAQQTVSPPVSTATPTGAPSSASIAAVQNIVEITRAVPAGTAAVDAFTVPAGVMLVVTDIVVTNTGTAAACGASVNRAGSVTSAPTPAASPRTTGTSTTTTTTPTLVTPPITLTPPPPGITGAGTSGTVGSVAPAASTPVTASSGTLTQTDSTVTGPLCVPAQTTTTLPLTTGIEFSSGQVVQLLNAPATAGTTGVAGSLAFHLRGLLITLT